LRILYSLILVIPLLATIHCFAQEQTPSLPEAPVTQQTKPPAEPELQENTGCVLTKCLATHRFWDKENDWLFAGVFASRFLDFASTKNFLARGRSEILLPDDIVYNNAGFAALEAAGAATSVGISYIFHRTGHHKMERWLSIGHISVTTFGAVRNYCLTSKHPPAMSQ
jgi:hypothetical protein